jgi:hypothetical protein
MLELEEELEEALEELPSRRRSECSVCSRISGRCVPAFRTIAVACRAVDKVIGQVHQAVLVVKSPVLTSVYQAVPGVKLVRRGSGATAEGREGT